MNENDLAPVVVFAYKRANLLRSTLDSLRENDLAEKTDVFIYIDAPIDVAEAERVNEVKAVAESFNGCRRKRIICSPLHKGLAASVNDGTTEILDEFGKAIIVEDDLHLSKGFLRYMNSMLQFYESDERIMQISGFGVKINKPKDYKSEYYLNKRAQSWGWATWKNRWNTIDWNISDYDDFRFNKTQLKDLRKLGSDLVGALDGYMKKEKDVWLIAYIYNMYRKNMYSICPISSFVKNLGFGADASNCRNYNRYSVEFADSIQYYEEPISLEYNTQIAKQTQKYWSLRCRMFGKLMTIVSVFSK